jgi:hypothetical protein
MKSAPYKAVYVMLCSDLLTVVDVTAAGAKSDKFEDAILQNLRPGEAGYIAGYEPKDFSVPPKQTVIAGN